MLFLLAFVLVFVKTLLLTAQGRNIAQGRYVASALFAMMIGAFLFYSMKIAVDSNFSPIVLVADAIGGALGTLTGIYLHQKFYK